MHSPVTCEHFPVGMQCCGLSHPGRAAGKPRQPSGCAALPESLAGKALPPARLEPTPAHPRQQSGPTEPCRGRTVLLLCRNASRCFTGTVGFAVAGINWFILLNDQVTTCYYTQNTRTENISPPPKPLKYSFKLKYQEVPTAFS